MPTNLEAEFRQALYLLDEKKVLAFFRGMKEEKRRILAPIIFTLGTSVADSIGNIPQEAIPEIHELPEAELSGLMQRLALNKPRYLQQYLQLVPKIQQFKNSLAVAAMATLLPEEYGTAYWTFDALPFAAEILADRKPAWIDDFFKSQNHLFQHNGWIHLYYELFKAGLCQRRLDDEMITRIVYALPNHYGADAEKTIRDDLLAMPDFLETEIWRIFELPLNAAPLREDQYSHRPQWKTAFVDLANNNEIDRPRLFRSLVDMLHRGMNEPAIKWCIGVFKDSKPTDKEIAAMFDGFPPLLDSRQAPVYTFACDIILKVGKANASFDEMIVAPLQMMLQDKSKTRAKQCLSLLETILKRSARLYDKVFSGMLAGLHHEAAEIQSTALKLVQKYRKPDDSQTTELLRNIASSLAPSVQKELNVDISSPTTTVAKPVKALPKPESPDSTGRLRHLAKLQPVQTVEELVDLALKIIESPIDCDEHELLLDGLDRLHDRRGDDFIKKTSSIRKIVLRDTNPIGIFPIHSWSGKYHDEDPVEIDLYGYYLSAIIVLWVADERSMSPDGAIIYATFEGKRTALDFIGHPNLEVIFGNRITHLARRMCNGITHQSLSTPTHSGGWIDPVVFVERINADPNNLATHDLNDYILALYRLAPDRRSEALTLLENDKDENIFTTTLKFLLGDPHYSYTEDDILKGEPSVKTEKNPWKEKALYHLEHATEAASRRAIGFVKRLQFLTSEERQKSLENLRSNPTPFVEFEVAKELASLLSLHYPELEPEADVDTTVKAMKEEMETKRQEMLLRHALITAAIRVRNPSTDPIRYSTNAYPDGEKSIRTRFLKRNSDKDYFPLYYMHKPFLQPRHYENKWVTGLVRWRMTVFPSHREPLYWNAIYSLTEQIEAGGNYLAPHGFLEPLLDLPEPMGVGATAATLVALAAKPQGLSMLAQDVLIAAIGDGRLNPQCLSTAVTLHLRQELPKTNRWNERFSVIANVSPEHAAVIRQMLESTLPVFPAKQLAPLVALFHELSVATGTPVSETTTIDFLKKLTGKNGQTAKKLLAIQ